MHQESSEALTEDDRDDDRNEGKEELGHTEAGNPISLETYYRAIRRFSVDADVFSICPLRQMFHE